jgi:DNA polymerase III epsilon subunit-like protein
MSEQTVREVKSSIPKGRLFFDIETSPNIGLFWEAGFKKTIPYDNIIKERAIICICYKWEGEEEVHYLFWDKSQNDRKLLKEFIAIANEATELIGHNSDKYDLAWIRTRALYHDLPMFPKYSTIDTLKIARSKFRFNSNRLDYIATFLGIGHKVETHFSLWKQILLSNDEYAKKEMIHYCKEDVRLLEKVYLRLQGHTESKVHYGVLSGSGKHSCTSCGSKNVKIAKTRLTATGRKNVQYQCKDCGRYSTQASKSLKEEALEKQIKKEKTS